MNAISTAKPIKWTSSAIQYAIVKQFDYVKYCIVPNIYLGADEMDIALLSPRKMLWEVEIKISMGDWKRDTEKKKWKEGPWEYSPSRFYYAVPESLVPKGKLPNWLQSEAGVLCIGNNRERKSQPDGTMVITDKPHVWFVRASKALHNNKLPQKYIDEMYRKLSIRYWNMAYKKEPGDEICLPEN